MITKTITFGKTTYHLQTEAPSNLAGHEIINNGLELARKILKITPLSRYLPKIPFDGIFCYDSQEINACADREGGMYYIAFSYDFFINIHNWLHLWKAAPAIKQIFTFENDKVKDIFFENVYKFMVMFTTRHEAFHILDGHCDIPQNEDHFMAERLKKPIGRDTLFSQCLEYDADYVASCACARTIFDTYPETLEAKKMHIRALCFGLYNLFLLFEETAVKSSFAEKLQRGYKDTTHPDPGIRVAYCNAIILAIAAEYLKPEEAVSLFNVIAGECIGFERVLVQHKRLQDCLYAMAYTKQGAEHMLFLNNTWNEVKQKLQPYAKVPLVEKEEADKMPYWIDDEGGFLKNS